MILLNFAGPVKANVQMLAADSHLPGEATILVVLSLVTTGHWQ